MAIAEMQGGEGVPCFQNPELYCINEEGREIIMWFYNFMYMAMRINSKNASLSDEELRTKLDYRLSIEGMPTLLEEFFSVGDKLSAIGENVFVDSGSPGEDGKRTGITYKKYCRLVNGICRDCPLAPR